MTKEFVAFTRLDASDVNTYLVNRPLQNAIINGAFDIWQRGTSISVAATVGAFTADRFMVNPGNSNCTISRQTGTPSTTAGNFALRYQRNSGQTGTNSQFIAQSLPNLDSATLIGRTLTLSFYAKKGADYSTTASALRARILSSTGTDQNFITVALTGQTTVAEKTVELGTGLERFTLTGTVPTNATQVHIVFDRAPVGTASTNDWYELEGVQLEAGTVATPFRRNANSIQGELAACQRYYWRTTYRAFTPIAFGSGTTTTVANVELDYKVTMRTHPTAVEWSGLLLGDLVAGGVTPTNITIGGANVNKIWLSATLSGGVVVNRPYYLYLSGTSSDFVGFSAEL
jgi:hypothetical protein